MIFRKSSRPIDWGRFVGFHSLWVRLSLLMLLTSLSLVMILVVFYHQTETRFY